MESTTLDQAWQSGFIVVTACLIIIIAALLWGTK
jgi:hypothetical protein